SKLIIDIIASSFLKVLSYISEYTSHITQIKFLFLNKYFYEKLFRNQFHFLSKFNFPNYMETVIIIDQYHIYITWFIFNANSAIDITVMHGDTNVLHKQVTLKHEDQNVEVDNSLLTLAALDATTELKAMQSRYIRQIYFFLMSGLE
ncbi:hypothetical protein ACJX0J_022355, partial [Zea mays]